MVAAGSIDVLRGADARYSKQHGGYSGILTFFVEVSTQIERHKSAISCSQAAAAGRCVVGHRFPKQHSIRSNMGKILFRNSDFD
uniref:Uncharacterized protein n=1 Tax=Leersia perrieri TaxID=77586 RepID=A0A0D9XPF5_9ORYZ